jgi:hypothetical protein
VPPDANWSSSGGGFSLVQDPSAPGADGYVGQQFYSDVGRRVGSATMSSVLQPHFAGKGYKGLYTCFWTKLDPAFTFQYPGGFFGTKQFWFLVGPKVEKTKSLQISILQILEMEMV